MIDTARILFSDSFEITKLISVRHSTLGDVIRLGEERYFRILQLLTAIPSDEKFLLYKNGIDWMEISDLEFFAMMVRGIPKEDSQIFLPGLDFSKFKLYKDDSGDVKFSDGVITIDLYSHQRMAECLCTIHRIKKKVEKADLLSDLRKKEFYVKPSVKKKLKSKIARMLIDKEARKKAKYLASSMDK